MSASCISTDPKAHHSLRQQLEDIITREPVRVHKARILKLAASHPQARLEMVGSSPSAKGHAYNCFMHVLNLVDRVEPNAESLPNGQIHFLVDSAFFRQLYESGLMTETTEAELQPLDLVVYYFDGEKRHVGQYISLGVVESKWGIGPLLRHGTWDVPNSYGHKLRYFKPPPQDAVDAFLRQQLPQVHLAK